MYKLGAYPSPHDYRDYPVAKVIPKTSYPEKYIPNKLKIKNQGDISACVAFSLSTIKEYQEHNEWGIYQEYSANFIYGNRGGSDYQGKGMYTREALKQLQKCGVCKEDLMPGIWHYPKQKRLFNEEIYKKAFPQRITTYAAINSIEEIKNAIYVNGPVLIVIPVYPSFYQCKDEARTPGSNEILQGYHAMVAIGYTNDRLIVQNSWGPSWGMGGLCYMPFNYPIIEKWAITDLVMQHDKIEMQIGSKSMKINGATKEIDIAPFIKKGRTCLPVRHIAEALDVEVEWDPKTKTVTLVR